MSSARPRKSPGLLRFGMPASSVRTWLLLVPLHVAAFAALYLGMEWFLESAFTRGAAASQKRAVEMAIAEMPFFSADGSYTSRPHDFRFVAARGDLGLSLFDLEGSVIAPGSVPADYYPNHVADFLANPLSQPRQWLETEGDKQRVSFLVAIRARAGCEECHELGEPLGVAFSSFELTEELAVLRHRLRFGLAGLVLAWGSLIGGTTFMVRRTADWVASRLEADMSAAERGQPMEDLSSELVLDPVTFEVHERLRSFVERQRRHEQEVASRMVHADRLATLGQVAAGLVHEIKNPLAGIQGALEVLRNETDDRPTAELYGEMIVELHRVHGILQNLLVSSRPSPLRLAEVDLGLLLEEVGRLLGPGLRRRQVELEIRPAERLPLVTADGEKIRQVLINLIQNAAEAMPHGGRVIARAAAVPQEDKVAVVIEDNGPGIPEEDLEKVFQPFYTTKFGGTGLGLAIAASLVEQHEGRIEVESEVGSATIFLLELPVRPTAMTGAQPASC